MTNKEFFTRVRDFENMPDDMIEKASALLNHMETARESAASKNAAKRAAENEPVIATIREFMADGVQHITSEVAAGCAISNAKASAMLRGMTAAGELTCADVKVKGKGTQKGYTAV